MTCLAYRMTLYHFANCLALAYTPYYLTYKYSGLSEYGAFWKVGQASFMYILTQLAKMLFLATFFPMSDLEEEEGEHQFDLLSDFLRSTVDIADLVGIYLVMSRVSGKGTVKVRVIVECCGTIFKDWLNYSRSKKKCFGTIRPI